MNANFLKLTAAVLLPACLILNIARAMHAGTRAETAPAARAAAMESPIEWRGRALRPLALSPVESRFARGFPGKIARLTDGEDTLVWRAIVRPTRMLHPAVDCYKALGWRISGEHLEQGDGSAENDRWRCFAAEREGVRLRVCERIEDASGASFTDVSAWYWAAVTGQSTGPWQAMTVANPL